MKQYILILLFTLAGLAGMAQTNEPLPGDAEPLTNQLYLSPSDSTVWAADPFSGLAIKVGTWVKVDSLFKLGYTKVQVDSAILSFRITPNMFKNKGYNDVEKIQKALDLAVSLHQTLFIGDNEEEGNSVWMLDSAILLRPGSDVEINNATIKLKNTARDNIFRSDNVGVGITSPVMTRDIAIRGVGTAILQGADIPRATGDASQNLTTTPTETGFVSYGTDAGVPGEHQKGDSRNIGVLIGLCDGVQISGLRIVNAHAYAISIERSINGLIEDISINNPDRRFINGDSTWVKNADGINLRYGIKNFTVNNVFGNSGDDFIALTTLNGEYGPGTTSTINITGNEYLGPQDNTHDVHINNVQAYSYRNFIRLLNIDDSELYNISITNVHDISQDVDTLRAGPTVGTRAMVTIGGGNSPTAGGTTPLGNCRNIYIDNMTGHRYFNGVHVVGSLAESSITNLYKANSTGSPAVYFAPESNGARNVLVDNVNNADSVVWYSSQINGLNNRTYRYVDTEANQDSIGGNKNWVGNFTSWSPTTPASPLPTPANSLSIYRTSGQPPLLTGRNGTAASFYLRAYSSSGTQLSLLEGGIDAAGAVTSTQFKLSSLNTAPASATATGTAGEIRFGTDGRIYICTATNTWIRSEPLTTW